MRSGGVRCPWRPGDGCHDFSLLTFRQGNVFSGAYALKLALAGDGYSTVGGVQGISDYGLELYAQSRWFTVDQDGFDDIIVGTVGSRLKF